MVCCCKQRRLRHIKGRHEQPVLPACPACLVMCWPGDSQWCRLCCCDYHASLAVCLCLDRALTMEASSHCNVTWSGETKLEEWRQLTMNSLP